MVLRRHVLISTSLIVSSLLLVHFQNCAPTGAVPNNNSHGGEVRVIDEWNKSEIQFVSEDVQIHDEAVSAAIGGLCNRTRSGSRLRWAIWAGNRNSAPLLAGESNCRMGNFEVNLPELENLVCGVQHILAVEGEWGGSTYTHVIRRCQPLASEIVAAPASSPAGTSCALEYNAATLEDPPCTQVCYRDSKVVRIDVVEPGQCTSLAAKLAGP